jgi:hypothetical protein
VGKGDLTMAKSDHKNDKDRKSFFELFTEIMGWLQIAASPFLIGLALGAIVYLLKPESLTLWIGIAISLAGLIFGIIWATRVWKKKGTIYYVSRVMATPEFDDFNDSEK